MFREVEGDVGDVDIDKGEVEFEGVMGVVVEGEVEEGDEEKEGGGGEVGFARKPNRSRIVLHACRMRSARPAGDISVMPVDREEVEGENGEAKGMDELEVEVEGVVVKGGGEIEAEVEVGEGEGEEGFVESDVGGARPEESIGSDEPVSREAAVAAAATLCSRLAHFQLI